MSRILRSHRGHVVSSRDADDDMQHQASMLKRQAARIVRDKQQAEKEEQERVAAARQRKQALLTKRAEANAAATTTTVAAGASGQPSTPLRVAHSSSASTPQSQFNANRLMEQLKSPGTSTPGSAEQLARPAVAAGGNETLAPARAAVLHAPAAAAATAASSIVDVAMMSYAEWQQWRSSWSTRKCMFFMLYGIRRTSSERETGSRVRKHVAEQTAGKSDVAAAHEVCEAGVDGLGLELSQCEQEDFILSPNCRTFFHASHFHRYPLRLENVAGIMLAFDDDATNSTSFAGAAAAHFPPGRLYNLRVGDIVRYNLTNPEGPTGRELWEAFCFALLLEPALSKVRTPHTAHLFDLARCGTVGPHPDSCADAGSWHEACC